MIAIPWRLSRMFLVQGALNHLLFGIIDFIIVEGVLIRLNAIA